MLPKQIRKHSNTYCWSCKTLPVTHWVTWGSQAAAYKMCDDCTRVYSFKNNFAIEVIKASVPDLEGEVWDD